MPAPDAELGVDALGVLADGPAAQDTQHPLVAEYHAWIEFRRNDYLDRALAVPVLGLGDAAFFSPVFPAS